MLLPRSIDATSLRIWGRPAPDAPPSGMFWMSCSDWMEYCGAWVTRL